MKKIMFNNKYGLTQAVLEERKTHTRRLLHCPKTFGGKYVSGFRICTNKQGVQFAYLVDEDECEIEGSVNTLSAYKIGEEVAVAQSYKDAYDNVYDRIVTYTLSKAGFYNKMFVRADLMPHRIKITDIRIERLQDISEEDCLKEGVQKVDYDTFVVDGIYVYDEGYEDGHLLFGTAREAFAALIDQICGKGTWDSNPWVFVYEFNLVK